MVYKFVLIVEILSASTGFAEPPGGDTTFSQLESRAYNEVEVRIEEVFYRNNRFVYNDLRDTLIRDGIRVYQEELRSLRQRIQTLANRKPDTAREAINFNMSFISNAKLSIKNIDFEIERWQSYVEEKQKSFDLVKDLYGKDIWNWRHAELEWASRMHYQAKQVKNLLLGFSDKIESARQFISELETAQKNGKLENSLKQSCLKLGFQIPI